MGAQILAHAHVEIDHLALNRRFCRNMQMRADDDEFVHGGYPFEKRKGTGHGGRRE
jgi:hypothetical protein